MEWIKWCSKRFTDPQARKVAMLARHLGRLEEDLSMHVDESSLTTKAGRLMFEARMVLKEDAERRERSIVV